MKKLKGRTIRKIAAKMTSDSALENLLSIMGEAPVKIPQEYTDAEWQLSYAASQTGISVIEIELGLHWQEHLTGYYLVAAEQGLTALIPYGIGKYIFYDQGLQRFQYVDRNTEAQFRKQTWEITPSLIKNVTPFAFVRNFLKQQAQAELPWMLLMTAILWVCSIILPHLGWDTLWNVVPSGKHFFAYVLQFGGVVLCGGLAAVQCCKLLRRVWEKADAQYATALMQRFLQRDTHDNKKTTAIGQFICAENCKIVLQSTAWIWFASSFGIVALVSTTYRISMLQLFAIAGLFVIGYAQMLRKKTPAREEAVLASRIEAQAFLCQMEIAKNLPRVDALPSRQKQAATSTFGYLSALSTAFLAIVFLQGMQAGMRPAMLVAYGLRAAPSLFCILRLTASLPAFIQMQYGAKTVLTDVAEELERDPRPAMLHCDGSLMLERVHAANLQEISLQVYPGEKIGVYGSVSSGKTTFLKILAGIIPIQFGAIYSSGRDCAQVQGQSRRRFIRFLQKADVVQIASAERSNTAILLLDQVCDADTAKCALAFPGTCILTAPRKQWLKGCDRVFRLENGQLMQEGW